MVMVYLLGKNFVYDLVVFKIFPSGTIYKNS